MNNEIFTTNKQINDAKIVLISDIHYYEGYKQKILDKILNQIIQVSPNYICIAGDVLDTTNDQNLDQLYEWLNELSSIAPTLVVLGNHDEKSGRIGNWKHKTNKEYIKQLNNINNLYLLDDNNKIFDSINFYGFNLSYNYYEANDEKYSIFEEEVKDLNPKFKKDTYNIILFHSPINIYKYINNNPNHPFNECDLILSGHMHNGCLPFWITNIINKVFKSTRSLISPLKIFFPKNAQGRIYKIKDGYVYQGINKLSHSTLFFHKFDFIFRKNIQIITIKKNTKN